MWPLYVFSVFASALSYPHAPVLAIIFAVVALSIACQSELRWLAGVLRDSAPSPRTDP